MRIYKNYCNIFKLFIISLLIFCSFSSHSRSRITSQVDVWCSSDDCSSAQQNVVDNPIAINVVPGAVWNNNQLQIEGNGGEGAGGFNFVSNTPNICTVNADGVITRLAIGNCQINVIKEADLEFAEHAEDIDFPIGCDNQNITIRPSDGWSDNNTKRLVLNGGAGNGAVMWMSTTPEICSINDDDPNFVSATQLAKGTCTVHAQKDQDNQNFICAADTSTSFTTALFSKIRIDNNRRSCPAGWINPTSAALESALAKGNLQGQAGLRAWYYCINGYNSFVKTADGYYKYRTRSGGRWRCPGARNQRFKTSYPWSKHGGNPPRARQACSTCGTTSVVCLQ